jgi:hypothetical protein
MPEIHAKGLKNETSNVGEGTETVYGCEELCGRKSLGRHGETRAIDPETFRKIHPLSLI